MSQRPQRNKKKKISSSRSRSRSPLKQSQKSTKTTKEKISKNQKKTEQIISSTQLYDLEEIKQFRRNIHQNAELGFKEFKTQKNIKNFLIAKGLQESSIKICATTGLVIDLKGTGLSIGDNKIIAFRADLDGLFMTENNPHLDYKSITEAAHMCGHDGHTASLVGFACKFFANIDKFPLNRTIRLLFQPSEEGPKSGAKQMIEEGCLENVEEVYGYHNWPSHPVGYMMVKPGITMSDVTIVSLTIIGKGGHASTPEKAIDPVQIQADFYIKFRELKKHFSNRNFVFTLPYLHIGERYNVIAILQQASQGFLKGTLECQEKDLTYEIKTEFEKILNDLKTQYQCEFILDWDVAFPLLINAQKETEYIAEIAKKVFDSEKVIIMENPIKAGEDFSFFAEKIPGCYFFLGGGKKFDDVMLHDSHFDYNDELLEPASEFWLQIALHRLSQQ